MEIFYLKSYIHLSSGLDSTKANLPSSMSVVLESGLVPDIRGVII